MSRREHEEPTEDTLQGGLIAEVPAADSAKAVAVLVAARELLPAPTGPAATEVLLQMREHERSAGFE